jgi:hypothetical protein
MNRYLVFISGLIIVSVVYLIPSMGPIVTKPCSLEVFAQGTNNTISMIAKLKPEENTILAGDDDRAYTLFQFNKSGAEELCPTNNCEYDNGRHRTSVDWGDVDGRGFLG